MKAKCEPKRPVHWRGITIDHSKKWHTNPLQGDYCFGKMLGTADVFPLLWDIEQELLSHGP